MPDALLKIDALTRIIMVAADHRPVPLVAQTFIKRYNSFSRPVVLTCDDNLDYVVKGRHAGRAIFNDHMIARLGLAMGAPVGEPALVVIPDELARNEPQMHDIATGVCHGTLFVQDTTDRSWLIHTDKGYNRQRFARLAVLYGWLCAQDNQLIYSNQEPHYVYSVDHGHFLPGGPNWTVSSLASAPVAQPLQDICGGCGLSSADIAEALAALRRVTMNDMIDSVAFPPDEWGVSMAERVAILCFVRKRRIEMLRRGFVWKGAP